MPSNNTKVTDTLQQFKIGDLVQLKIDWAFAYPVYSSIEVIDNSSQTGLPNKKQKKAQLKKAILSSVRGMPYIKTAATPYNRRTIPELVGASVGEVKKIARNHLFFVCMGPIYVDMTYDYSWTNVHRHILSLIKEPKNKIKLNAYYQIMIGNKKLWFPEDSIEIPEK